MDKYRLEKYGTYVPLDYCHTAKDCQKQQINNS